MDNIEKKESLNNPMSQPIPLSFHQLINDPDSLQQFWDAVLATLKTSLSNPGFHTFFSGAFPDSIIENILTICVPNQFAKEWIHDHCEPLILQELLLVGISQPMIEYKIHLPSAKSTDEQLSIFSAMPSPEASEPTSDVSLKFSFDDFIVGHNNRFAYAASEAVSKAPSKAYNPLFIYGSVGLGKTHLLHAIAHDVKKRYPSLKIELVSSEKFTNELINSIRDKKIDAFRSKYRNVDVLLVDDIQFLSGKTQTQEEFFHTFNDLHSNSKQIVMTCDRPPKEIPTLEVRLRTRFEWGLIADIQPPEFETRIAILRKKTELFNLTISDEILHYIATQIPTNIREMEGCLTRISAYASLINTDITLAMASNVIRDMIGVKNEKPLTIHYIQRKICDYFNISTVDLVSKSRTRDLAYPRQIAMYLARELTNASLPKIGEHFGNRDHSTVMHACDKVKTMMESDPETRSIVTVLISNIKNDQ